MNEQQRIKILSDLTAIKSVNDNEQEVALYLQKLLKEHGIPSKLISYDDNRASLVAEIGNGSRPIIAFSGHEDVVAAGDSWKNDPFKLTEIDGKLYGRGTSDMKSGLADIVIAMIELKENNTKLNGTVRLLASLGEEIGEYGAEQLTKEGYMDDVDALIIAEPSNTQTKDGTRILRLCYATKGSLDMQIQSKGKQAHSSLPETGNNAVQNLLDVLYKINNKIGKVNAIDPVTGKFLFNFDVISGGTQVNTIPASAKAEFNARTIKEFDNEKVKDIVNNSINELNQSDKKYHLSSKVLMQLDPVTSTKDNNLDKLIMKVTTRYLDNEFKQTGLSAITDATQYLKNKPDNFPMAIFGPGQTDSAHISNEYVYKDFYLKFADIYKVIMKAYLK